MLSERDIDAAHPEAFDFAFGNLPSAKRADFNRHLIGCRYCLAVVDEYADIGQIIKSLPPHVEPPADLQDRTITAMLAVLAEGRAEADPRSDAQDQAVTRLYPRLERQPSAEPTTVARPIPQLRPPAQEETKDPPAPFDQRPPAETAAWSMVTRLPVWRRHRGRFAAIAAVAAAIILAAIVVPLSLGRGPIAVTVAIPLHATTAAKVFGVGAATGQATARQDASGSWDITLTVSAPQKLWGRAVVRMLVRQPETWTGGARWLIPGSR